MEETDSLDELLICRLGVARHALQPCTLIIFGASGDLTSRKLVPACFQLFREKQMPDPFRIIGVARRDKTDSSWRDELTAALPLFSGHPADPELWDDFARNLSYCRGDFSDRQTFLDLREKLNGLPSEPLRKNLLLYLATPPSQFAEVADHLHEVGLLRKGEADGYWQRLVVEKPFGHDLASAQQLNIQLTRFANEKQIYRIDHYLGKETVQNILMFRFSNAIFEQIWNRQSVDHVQITVSEQLGVGTRGGYYEEAGALRDMLQNHLLQVLALIAMEPPASLEAEAVRDEKVKLLASVRPFSEADLNERCVRGQYLRGEVQGEIRPGYRDEPRVDPHSSIETFVAVRLAIDNWRWSGVPFFLRTGKRLPLSASEVRVQFRPTPNVLFAAQCGPSLDANSITLRLQPNEGISLRFNGKIPGNSMRLRPVRMHFRYNTEFGAYTPEAYERLLLEAMAGDATLFIRRDEVETAWRLVDPARLFWQDQPLTDREFYPAGSWGPLAAEQMIAHTGHTWRNPEPLV